MKGHYRYRNSTALPPHFFAIECIEKAAQQNADELGFGIRQLMHEGLTWMMSGLRIHYLPALQNPEPEWSVVTWPSGTSSLQAYRDFRLSNTHGVQVAEASSSWLMVDIDKRKVSRNNRFKEILDKMPIPEHGRRPESMEKPAVSAIPVRTAEHTVTSELLDENHHMNYQHYIRWSLEGIPDQRIDELQFFFRHEALLNDVIRVDCYQQKGLYFHEVRNVGKGNVIASGFTRATPENLDNP